MSKCSQGPSTSLDPLPDTWWQLSSQLHIKGESRVTSFYQLSSGAHLEEVGSLADQQGVRLWLHMDVVGVLQ